jgi:hypothetical protein
MMQKVSHYSNWEINRQSREGRNDTGRIRTYNCWNKPNLAKLARQWRKMQYRRTKGWEGRCPERRHRERREREEKREEKRIAKGRRAEGKGHQGLALSWSGMKDLRQTATNVLFRTLSSLVGGLRLNTERI